MKRLLSLIILLLLTVPALAGDYCTGFQDGYVAGYCYTNTLGCIPPIVPICPIPRLGDDGYQDGYNRGFLMGLSRGKR